jgi:2',3'-cyclic-nucleotide 2'-phosphodiesterase/3'-nucleotidase
MAALWFNRPMGQLPMHLRRGFLFFLLTSLLVVLAIAPAGTAERVTIVVLATTDLHGAIYPLDYYADRPAALGLARVSTLVEEERRLHPEAMLIDCGDTIQGSPLEYLHQRAVREKGGTASRDPMMLVMNYLRYDAMAVGNHEFNFGLPVLLKARGEAEFLWISANVTPAATEQEAIAVSKRQYEKAADHMGDRTFEPMLLKQVNGVQVAVIGLTTPAIPNWEPPEHIQGYRFEPAPEAARFWVRHARQVRDADLVILAAHTGLERDPESGEPVGDQLAGENAVYQLAAGTSGVDAIVFGHTHQEVPERVLNNVLLVQPKNGGRSLAELTFVLERPDGGGRWQVSEKRSRLIPVTNDTPADPKVLEIARPYHEAAERYLKTPVAQAARDLDTRLGRVVPGGGALEAIHEVQLAAAKADVSLAALFNASLRIPKGPVTVRQLASLYVYENTLVAIEATGRMLKDALEHSARYFNQYRGPGGGPLINPKVFGFNYDTAAGVTYRIDLSQPAGQRIVDLRFKGQPLAPDRKLRLAINSYRKSGGGGYTMFHDARVLWQSNQDIRQLMIDYYTNKKVIDGRGQPAWEIEPEAARRALVQEVEGAAQPAH